MTFTVQLHLFDTLNNANVRKCYFISIFEKSFNTVIGYGSFIKQLPGKG